MHEKAPPPIAHFAGRRTPPIAAVWLELCQLKHLFRRGWLRVGVPRDRCESVAEHSFGVALLSLLIAENFYPEADAGRIVRVAMVHDAGEARVGDITPHDGRSVEEKHALERRAVKEIFSHLPNGDAYVALWEEYERGETLEARIVKQADRLEMALQAVVYEHDGFGDLRQFFESARRAMQMPELKSLLDGIEKLRPHRPPAS